MDQLITKVKYMQQSEKQIDMALFSGFCRRQEVTRCWRKIDGAWCIREIAFIDDWTQDNYAEIVSELKRTARNGGWVEGAFLDERLKGFASVAPERFGTGQAYLDLSFLIVSADARRTGIGRALFWHAAAFAEARGAKKLYISAHSAVETQSFYRALGCSQAQYYSAKHVEKEPCDCQLEYALEQLGTEKDI